MDRLVAHAPLADLLRTQADGILVAWERRVSAPSHPHYFARGAEVRRWLEGHLSAMVETLTTGQPMRLEAHAAASARQRPRDGFDLGESIDAWLSLPVAVAPFLIQRFGGDHACLAAAFDALHETVRAAVSHFARLFAEELQQAESEERRRREHLAVLEERQKLARDLHDSVNQEVYGVSVYAEAAIRRLQSGDLEKVDDHLRQVRDSAAEALRDMRLLIYELRPPVLEEEGLVGALRARLAGVEERAGITATFTTCAIDRLPCRVEDELYGIAHEALNNALKHSGAREIHVDLSADGGRVTLAVTDNGCGFEPEAAAMTGGVGLPGMRERAARLGAIVLVESTLGKGTTVRVELPLPPDDESRGRPPESVTK